MGMMRAGRWLILLLLTLVAAAPAWAQNDAGRDGVWASVQVGYGVLDTFSDQEPHDPHGAFALAFEVGGTLSRHVRLGGQIGGWLLEPSDLWDPETGESVSRVLAMALVYPWSSRAVFVKAGVGRAIYTNHHPEEFGSSGWGGIVAVGYDWPAGRRFSLTPVIHYGWGGLGQVKNLLANIQNRGYRVFDFGIALGYG